MSVSYAEKLQDPRWQRRRLEILQRDKWTCQHCDNSERTLHVHHRYYGPHPDPWESPDAALVTLCASCHEYETANWASSVQLLVAQLKNSGFSAVHLELLACALSTGDRNVRDEILKIILPAAINSKLWQEHVNA